MFDTLAHPRLKISRQTAHQRYVMFWCAAICRATRTVVYWSKSRFA